MDRKVAQVTQRGVAGTEVVDAQRETGLVECLEIGLLRRVQPDHGVLSQLDPHPVRSHSGLFHQALEQFDHSPVGELPLGQIH